MKKIVMVFIAVMLTACSLIGQDELSLNQKKWKDANITHYRLYLFVNCFCTFFKDMPLVIEVKDGEIVSMKYHTGNPMTEADREYFSRYATVEDLFSVADAYLASIMGEASVKYDPTYGFPEHISIDHHTRFADGDVSYWVMEFEALP